jgi:hypothetical protein
MVKHHELIPGKKYKLGDVKVGKYLRKSDDGQGLIFLNSQYGEKGENEIEIDEEDNYEKILSPKRKSKSSKSRKSSSGGKKRKHTRRKK